jgi:hypothetical protein
LDLRFFSYKYYVEEDGVFFMEAIVSVSGIAIPVENVPYGIPQAQGNSTGLPPALSTSGASRLPLSIPASRSYIPPYLLAQSTIPIPTAKVLESE